MALDEQFPEITRRSEPLAPLTYLRVGGPAEYLVRPRTRDELARVVSRCYADGIPLRVLGTGMNLLVRDEGVAGAVLRLDAPEFTEIRVQGKRAFSGSGAALSALISETARGGLAGLEALVGILGTVGGVLRCNAGDGSSSIGQAVRSVDVMDEQGRIRTRSRDEIRFDDHDSDLDDPVILSSELELEHDSADALVKRMRKAWIHRKAAQPLSFQHAVRAFKDPAGGRAGELIDRSGLTHTKVGAARLSERNANYLVADGGANARDVLRLLEVLEQQVRERTGVRLEREVIIW